MSLLRPAERRFLTAISRLTYENPFTPERIRHEREALGDRFLEADAVWSYRPEAGPERANIGRLVEQVEPMAADLRDRLARGAEVSDADAGLYQDLVFYLLYHRHRVELHRHIGRTAQTPPGRPPPLRSYDLFTRAYHHHMRVPGAALPAPPDPAHVFALFFQIRRAFNHIFDCIVGGSMPTASLRAAVWQSIFTHDLRRYQRVLYERMGDVTTLVTGASGTGKELVARAIGLSRYIPFDAESRRFTEHYTSSFHALNLSALSPTLIESELFGHRRGAFTGALADHAGWLAVCGPLGTVFLDEIGDLDPAIQVKLLRVLQTRAFQSLGATAAQRFEGKVIAATNRDLAARMRDGAFREDFYYRLCSDMIRTPSLREQLADAPGELHNLVLFIARRATNEAEAPAVAMEVERWIEQNIEPDYGWPGNIRELEQCVWNVLIRSTYRPHASDEDTTTGAGQSLAADLSALSLSADEVLDRYCTLAYARTGSYQEAARRLGLDRRTVRSRVDEAMLGQLRAEAD